MTPFLIEQHASNGAMESMIAISMKTKVDMRSAGFFQYSVPDLLKLEETSLPLDADGAILKYIAISLVFLFQNLREKNTDWNPTLNWFVRR